MEFEDEHEEEEVQEGDDDDELGEEITLPPPPPPPPQVIPPSYDSGSNFPRVSNSQRLIRSGVTRYRECLKNHAVNIGAHALDGCGEFMPAGEDGTLDALKCAACNCHRNFHRKETTTTTAAAGGAFYYRAPAGYLHAPPRPAVARPSTSSGEIVHDGLGAAMMMKRKRLRTKFTEEQKDKMLGFAERLGWRIQKHDEAAVDQFCAEIQIKRQVLKVWMHNNKNTLANKKP